MNKEIEELLNKIRNSIKTHKELNLDDDMLVVLEFDVIQWNLLLSYIEQLNLENKFAKEYEKSYREIYKKYEQLENNRDKAIEYLKFIQMDKTDKYIPLRDYKEFGILLRMLGEIDNE